MADEKSAESTQFEPSAQLLDDTEKAIAVARGALLISTTARTAFHEKLLVITAGSLTIVATLATSVYEKPLAEKWITHRLLSLLATSAILFFLSLVASLIHNFLEAEAFHFEASSEREGTTRKIIGAVTREALDQSVDEQTRNSVVQIVREEVDRKFESKQALHLRRAETLRSFSHWFGISALIAFMTGYVPAIIFVVCLALF